MSQFSLLGKMPAMLKYTENAQVLARMKATTVKGSYKGYWGREGWWRKDEIMRFSGWFFISSIMH